MTIPDLIDSQLHLPEITITGHNGTVTLTPEQGRRVLAGGELVVTDGKVVVR